MVLASPAAPSVRCDETDDLVAGLNQLSVNDSQLIRTVTLEPCDPQHLTNTRSSLDHDVATNDLIHGLHVFVPTEQNKSRRPRFSFDQVCCSILKAERVSLDATHDTGNTDFFGT